MCLSNIKESSDKCLTMMLINLSNTHMEKILLGALCKNGLN